MFLNLALGKLLMYIIKIIYLLIYTISDFFFPRCLLVARKLHYSPETAGLIINSCAILHNIAVRSQIPVLEISEAERLEEEALQVHGPYQLHIERDAHSPYPFFRGNLGLHQGRQAQQNLIQRLWSERF